MQRRPKHAQNVPCDWMLSKESKRNRHPHAGAKSNQVGCSAGCVRHKGDEASRSRSLSYDLAIWRYSRRLGSASDKTGQPWELERTPAKSETVPQPERCCPRLGPGHRNLEAHRITRGRL